MTGAPQALDIADVVVRYGSVTALDGVCIAVPDGQVLAILGPSGSGKTTLLGAVAGFVPVASGSIRIGGTLVADARTDVPIERRGVGVVFQSYGLWPHLNVLETVAYPLRRQGLSRARARARAAELVAAVGLDGKQDRTPGQLSGGEQQRVGLARAMARQPRLFLFDEPTANLDSGLRSGLQRQIRQQQQATGAAALYVTHDPNEAFAVADEVAVIRHSRLVQVAPPRDIYAAPADEWVARLTGPCSVLTGEVLSADTVRLAGVSVGSVALQNVPTVVGGAARFALRPEAVRFGRAGQFALAGTVASMTFAGGHTTAVVDGPAGSVVVHIPGDDPARPGDAVSWQPTALAVLGEDGAVQ